MQLCARSTVLSEAVRESHTEVLSMNSPAKLRLIWLFAKMPEHSLRAVARRIQVERLEQGVRMFTRGDEASRGMIILLDGCIAVGGSITPQPDLIGPPHCFWSKTEMWHQRIYLVTIKTAL